MNSLWIKILSALATDPNVIGRMLDNIGCLPNIKGKSIGGVFFWEDLANVNGWRVQRNLVFGNCRILDPENIRRAWGGEKAILDAFSAISGLNC